MCLSPRRSSSTISFSEERVPLDTAVVSEILGYQGVFQDEEQKLTCRRLVESLSPLEQETAARTCYAYFLISVFGEEPPSEELRIQAAMKEACRHVQRRSFERGLESLKNACSFRKEWSVDLLKLCFTDTSNLTSLSEEDNRFIRKAEELIEKELTRHPMVVRGFDAENRAIVHRSYPRHAPEGEPDEKAFILSILYIVERVFACNEIASLGRQDKSVFVVDYSKHDASKGTPLSFTKESLKLLRSNYPNRVHKVFLLDTPMLIRGLYNIVSPFLGAKTREKLQFFTGKKQKQNGFQKLVEPESATTFMMKGGKLSPEVDIPHFLCAVPFSKPYDK